MLQNLRITNLAIIDELHLEFDRGFTVLTGETGAGKSMLVDAINLILGGRASAELIRTGEDSATVEAVFLLDAESRAAAEAAGVSFGEGNELLVKRVFSRAGKNKVFLNGGPATLAMLSALGPRLIDIAGQHEHQSLLVPESHRSIVDAAGESRETLARMEEAFTRYQQLKREADELASKEVDRARREDYLRFQVDELRRAELRDGEEETLALERQRLTHAEALDDSVTRGEEVLYSGDAAVASQLKAVHAQLGTAVRIDATLGPLLAMLESARVEIEEVARSLRDYRRAESDPARLEEVEDRLAMLDRLRKKHGAKDATGLLALQAGLEADLAELSSLDEALAARRASEEAAKLAALEVAKALTVARRKTGTTLGKQVAKELVALGMVHTRFDVAVRPGTLSAEGADDVEFLISPNPGEELKALAKTASGGELSRVMLALKCVVAAHHPVATYVFDEVDAGIGGAIAERVGKKLEDVAGLRHQVLCITHLPQIAVLADAHLRVAKSVAAGRTSIAVTKLDGSSREDEIARMLGGVEITQATRAHAREMLSRGDAPARRPRPAAARARG